MKAETTFKDMDQSSLEDAVSKALEKRLGSPVEIYESANFGVVAFERLTGSDARKVEWQELAAELARETGIGISCVANADWQCDDREWDEEATFIAFTVPGVPENYLDDSRNGIVPVDPATAPSAEDFVNAKRARLIVKNHLLELGSKRDMLISAQRSEREVLDRIADIEKLKDLAASDREAVAAVLNLDFDQALGAVQPVMAGPMP